MIRSERVEFDSASDAVRGALYLPAAPQAWSRRWRSPTAEESLPEAISKTSPPASLAWLAIGLYCGPLTTGSVTVDAAVALCWMVCVTFTSRAPAATVSPVPRLRS